VPQTWCCAAVVVCRCVRRSRGDNAMPCPGCVCVQRGCGCVSGGYGPAKGIAQRHTAIDDVARRRHLPRRPSYRGGARPPLETHTLRHIRWQQSGKFAAAQSSKRG
jgi:hypothetical protein